MKNSYTKIDNTKIYVRRKLFIYLYIALAIFTFFGISFSLLLADIALICFLYPSIRAISFENGKSKKIIVSRKEWKKYRRENNISYLDQFSYFKIGTKVNNKPERGKTIVKDESTKVEVIKPTLREKVEEDLPKAEIYKTKIDESNKSDGNLDIVKYDKLETRQSDNQIKLSHNVKALQYRNDRIHKPKFIKPLPTLNGYNNSSENSIDISNLSFGTSDKLNFDFKIDTSLGEIITSLGNYKIVNIRSAFPYFGINEAGVFINFKNNEQVQFPIINIKAGKYKQAYDKISGILSQLYTEIEKCIESNMRLESVQEYLKLKDDVTLYNFGKANFGIDSENNSLFIDKLYKNEGYNLLSLSQIKNIQENDTAYSKYNTEYLVFNILTKDNRRYTATINKFSTFDAKSERQLELTILKNLRAMCNLEVKD